jgi:hypothetical protein
MRHITSATTAPPAPRIEALREAPLQLRGLRTIRWLLRSAGQTQEARCERKDAPPTTTATNQCRNLSLRSSNPSGRPNAMRITLQSTKNIAKTRALVGKMRLLPAHRAFRVTVERPLRKDRYYNVESRSNRAAVPARSGLGSGRRTAVGRPTIWPLRTLASSGSSCRSRSRRELFQSRPCAHWLQNNSANPSKTSASPFRSRAVTGKLRPDRAGRPGGRALLGCRKHGQDWLEKAHQRKFLAQVSR